MTTDSRNIVMVTADSFRADHCGFIESESSLTPTMDRLANEGLSFTQAVAPGPRTPSSVPVIFTGEFMIENEDWRRQDWQGRRSRIRQHLERFTHLSERLQQRGYETAAFTTNPWTTHDITFDMGFDDFNEVRADSPDVSSEYISDSTLYKLADAGIQILPGDPGGWSSKKEWFSQWTGYFELIEERLASLSEPFFLWIFLLDTHQPYITPRRYRKESAAWEMYYSVMRYWHGEINDEDLPDRAANLIGQAYRDAVRSVDGFMKTLSDTVSPYDPVTVFFSDHGEALGEHGNFGHEQTLYEENLRVPLLIHNAKKSKTIDEQFPLQSLPELLVGLTEDETLDPYSYTQQFVVSNTEDNQTSSVRSTRWKLVSDGNRTQLFDLQVDPAETDDVSDSHPRIFTLFKKVLEEHERTQVEKETINDTVTNLLADKTGL